MGRHRVAIFPEQFGPHFNVPVLDFSQAPIDVGASGVGFGGSELAVEIRGVRLVGDVVKPGSRSRSHGRNLATLPALCQFLSDCST